MFIFKKSDINGIDLTRLVNLTKSEGRVILSNPLRRRGTVTLSRVKAANALNVSVEAMDLLVKRGVLKQYRIKRPDKGSAEKYCFSLRAVERWKEQSVSCTRVVSLVAAARMFGSTPDNVYKKYIQTGRLKAVITGTQRSDYYFSVEDVEALIRLNKQTITASNAAAICNVNLTCIHKLTLAGELNPISGPKVDGFGHYLYLRVDAERLYAQRQAFKARRNNQGGTSRFGRPAGPQRSPVLERIRPRINQLVRQWNAKPQVQRISGQRLHSQLIQEGYQVGINTVYVCLRELRQQTSSD